MSNSNKNYIENQVIYDLETFSNCFTYCSVDSDGDNLKVFEISDRKNQLGDILTELRLLVKNKTSMVGFNNLGFDYNLIHYIITKARKSKDYGKELKVSAKELFNYAQKVINSKKDDKFGISVKDEDVVIKQVDLYKIYHFDNKAKATSLKMLEFNMRSENIEDLPFPVGMTLDNTQKDVLIEYNKHDVLQTLKFYQNSVEAIKFREDLSIKFGFDCTNLNDTKIGKELFIHELEKAKQGTCYIEHMGRRQLKKTPRNKIQINDCILPYVKFKSDEFNAVLDWFKKQTITETKGVFTDIEEHDLGELAKYSEMVVKRKKFNDPNDIKNKRYVVTQDVIDDFLKEHPLGWIEEKELKSPKGAKSYYGCWRIAETLNVVYKGFRLDFGTGGIHGSVTGVVKSDDDYEIWDHDVKSYYPNLSIKNTVYPEHLTSLFCDVYQNLYVERGNHHKLSGLNKAIKLALNGVYGESNNEFSCFYDPKFTMTITINGQLSLCMLIEKLHDYCDMKMIQANTDGVTVFVNKNSKEMMFRVIKAWEKYTKLEMESVFYKSMHMRDVNNYVSFYENGDSKRKGAYEYRDLDWHKNQSALVIQMAVEHELTGKGTIEEFVMNHKEPYDFMLRTKVPRSSRLVLLNEDCGSEIQLQNICRYYPSTNGGKLIKIMPPLKYGDPERRLAIDKEWNVVPCNDMNNFHWDIDYTYYINEARKLVDVLQNNPF